MSAAAELDRDIAARKAKAAVYGARHWLTDYPAATHLKLEPSIWPDYPGSLS